MRYTTSTDSESETESDTDCQSEISSKDSGGDLESGEEDSPDRRAPTDSTSKQPAETLPDKASDLCFVTEELDCGVTLDEILSALSLEDSIPDGTHFELLSIGKVPLAELDEDSTAKPFPEFQSHPDAAIVKGQNLEHLNNTEGEFCVKNQKVLSDKVESEDDDVSSDGDGEVDEETAAELELMRQLGLPVWLGSHSRNQSQVCVQLGHLLSV